MVPRTLLRESGAWKESNYSAETWATPDEFPVPWAGSVPSSGVTETSETLVCINNSSRSARDCGSPTQRVPQVPARGSCAKTAQAAASPWFGEGSAADYWGTAGEPFLLSACSQNKEPNFNFNFTFISTLNTCPRAWFFSSFNSQLHFTLFPS